MKKIFDSNFVFPFHSKIIIIPGTLAERERLHRIKLREQKAIWDEEQRILANRRTRGLKINEISSKNISTD